MKLNADKCHLLVIGQRCDDPVAVKIGNAEVVNSSEEKLLGVHIDSKLSFDHHVSKLCQNASNKLYAFARISPYMDHNKLSILMRAFITSQFQYCPLVWMFHNRQPHFDYACSAWFPMLTKRLTKKIQTAQNKCIRFCLNLNNRAHVGIKEFKDINWLPTKERFEQCTATNVFKFFNNSAPSYMSEMFSPVGQGRITRRSKNKLNLPFRKTNMGQNGLSYIGPKIWNSLQSDLKSSNNVNSFKHKIKDKFFNDLQKRENSPYIYY